MEQIVRPLTVGQSHKHIPDVQIYHSGLGRRRHECTGLAIGKLETTVGILEEKSERAGIQVRSRSWKVYKRGIVVVPPIGMCAQAGQIHSLRNRRIGNADEMMKTEYKVGWVTGLVPTLYTYDRDLNSLTY